MRPSQNVYQIKTVNDSTIWNEIMKVPPKYFNQCDLQYRTPLNQAGDVMVMHPTARNIGHQSINFGSVQCYTRYILILSGVFKFLIFSC